MRLDGHAMLDALCGEYLVGTLRGAARRRFERALAEESGVAVRLRRWQELAPRYSMKAEAQPPRHGWSRLEAELGLAQYRMPWHRRGDFWGAAAALAASVVLIIAFVIQINEPARRLVEIAELSATDDPLRVIAQRSRDGGTLALRATKPMVAGPKRSYELWLIPAEGGDPVSLAVLDALDASFALDERHRGRVRPGASLAVSTEPAGGSPTGKPTGPVILAGRINL